MIARVQSYALSGLEGVCVTVEADVSRGLPSYEMVGLPDAAVKEAKNRVQSACENSGYVFKASGKVLVFAGFTAVYQDMSAKKEDEDSIDLAKLLPVQTTRRGNPASAAKGVPRRNALAPFFRHFLGRAKKWHPKPVQRTREAVCAYGGAQSKKWHKPSVSARR